MSELNINEIIDEVKVLRDINSRRAIFSLIGLVAVFSLSISFFLFSDYLFSPQFNRNDERLINQLNELNSEYETVKSDISLAEKRDSVSDKEINLTEKDKKKLSTLPPAAVLIEKANHLKAQKEAVLNELSAVQENRLSSLQSSDKSKNIESIIATSVTRIGAVFLSVFMMQILLGFFRYYTRLSNHYAAKILALKTTNHSNPEGVAEVVSAMQPESITFGAEPQMPFDKICELLKTIR